MIIFIVINMRNMEIIKELSVFNNIKYYDEPHVYYIDGQKTISCTGFIHNFEEEFESNVDKPDKWAEKQGHFYKAKSMADKYAHKQKILMVDQIILNPNHQKNVFPKKI